MKTPLKDVVISLSKRKTTTWSEGFFFLESKEKFKKSHFRKGMVLLSSIANEHVAFREFEARVA